MLESDPTPRPPVKLAPVRPVADVRLAATAPRRYELESVRLSHLTTFVNYFAPASTNEIGFGQRADDVTDAIILAARDAAILDAFLAIRRIARES